MTTTTDLKDFGLRELRVAADLLNAYCDRPPDWLGSGLTLMMNRSSGYVFLTDEDCNVAMMHGGRLDAWLFTPYDGHEGFIGDLAQQFSPDDLHEDDADYIRHWAEVLAFDLPQGWIEEDGGNERLALTGGDS